MWIAVEDRGSEEELDGEKVPNKLSAGYPREKKMQGAQRGRESAKMSLKGKDPGKRRILLKPKCS